MYLKNGEENQDYLSFFLISDEIVGIWFFDPEECQRFGDLLVKYVSLFSIIPCKALISFLVFQYNTKQRLKNNLCFILQNMHLLNYFFNELTEIFLTSGYLYANFRLSMLCKDETKLKIALMMETQRQEEIKKVYIKIFTT